MKKITGMLLVMALVMTIFCGALANGPMVDKDIQFSGHTFGENFLSARKAIQINSIDFNIGRNAYYSRMLADPAASYVVRNIGNESAIPYLFSARAQGQAVAGHDAQPTLYFMFSSKEAAQNFELGSTMLYGATYDFYNGNVSDIYHDLKTKLTSVYGEPYAENANFNEIWGPLASSRKDMRQEDIDRNYQEGLDRYQQISYTAWKSSTNNGLILLVNYNEGGNWENTRLHYFDLSVDEAIMEMYAAGSVTNDSVDGL